MARAWAGRGGQSRYGAVTWLFIIWARPQIIRLTEYEGGGEGDRGNVGARQPYICSRCRIDIHIYAQISTSTIYLSYRVSQAPQKLFCSELLDSWIAICDGSNVTNRCMELAQYTLYKLYPTVNCQTFFIPRMLRYLLRLPGIRYLCCQCGW